MNTKGENEAKVNHLLEKKYLYPFGTVNVIVCPIENILRSLNSYGPRIAQTSFKNKKRSYTVRVEG